MDGVEGINATHSSHLSKSHNDPAFDRKAIVYSQKHQLPMTAGSDVHSTYIFGGGVAFRRKLHDVRDYCEAIRSGEEYVMTNGDTWYDREGREIVLPKFY